MHGNVSGTVSEAEAAYAAVKLVKGRAQLAEFRATGKAKKGSEAVAAVKCGDAGQGKENEMTTDREDLAVRIWRQVEHGVDVDLLPTSSASIFDHGIEMMQLDPFRQFGPFFFTQTDHIELLHNHPSQLMASSLLGGNLSCLCITLNSY